MACEQAVRDDQGQIVQCGKATAWTSVATYVGAEGKEIKLTSSFCEQHRPPEGVRSY